MCRVAYEEACILLYITDPLALTQSWEPTLDLSDRRHHRTEPLPITVGVQNLRGLYRILRLSGKRAVVSERINRGCKGQPAWWCGRTSPLLPSWRVSYKYRMSKQAVSVTLAAENLLWLRGQARASGAPSMSAVLDRLVSAARAGGQVHESTIRSVVGTVRIAEADPELVRADAAVRALFRGALVSEEAGRYRGRRKTAKTPSHTHRARR